MNLRRGLRRITLILAILVGIICGTTAIGMLIEKRSSALRRLAECEAELVESIQVEYPNERPVGWLQWSSESGPPPSDYLEKLSWSILVTRVNLTCCIKAATLINAHKRFVVGLSMNEIVLIGLGCAIAGFCGIWLLYAIIDCLVVPLVFWVSKGFHKDSG